MAYKNKHNYPNRQTAPILPGKKNAHQRKSIPKMVLHFGLMVPFASKYALPMSSWTNNFTKNTDEMYNIEYTLSKSQKHNQTHIDGTTTVTQT